MSDMILDGGLIIHRFHLLKSSCCTTLFLASVFFLVALGFFCSGYV